MSSTSFVVPAESRKGIAQFIQKMVAILETSDPAVCCWSADGQSFFVKDPKAFSSSVLGNHFKSSQFSSFIRQLNFYSFNKVQTPGAHNGPWEFRHKNFVRGRYDLMATIKRKTSSDYHVVYDQEVKKLKATISSLRGNVKDLSGQLEAALAQVAKLQQEKEAAQQAAAAAQHALAASGGASLESLPSGRRAKRRRIEIPVPGGAPLGRGAGAPAPEVPSFDDTPMVEADRLPDDLFSSLLNMELEDDANTSRNPGFDGDLDLSWLADPQEGTTPAAQGTSPLTLQRSLSTSSILSSNDAVKPLGLLASDSTSADEKVDWARWMHEPTIMAVTMAAATAANATLQLAAPAMLAQAAKANRASLRVSH